MPKLTEDHVHVLLDAIEVAYRNAGHGFLNSPWLNYDPSEDDPKTSKEGWAGLLGEAREALTHILDTGREMEF